MTPSVQSSGNPGDGPRGVPVIVLIGPVGAGKSTMGKLLSTQLGLPHISLDEIAPSYYEEYGFGSAAFERVEKEDGFLAAYRQIWPALAYATERVLADAGKCVLDLGAGHTHYEDPILFERVRRALEPCPNIVLLLPSSDPDRSVILLRERSIAEREWDWIADGYDFMERWVKDPDNQELATLAVFTEGRTPEETCSEILQRVRFAET